MTVEWARIGDVVRLRRRPQDVQADQTYVFLGISAGGGGFFRKPPVAGVEIAGGHAFAVAPGDFVYSRLFAWRGSFEIASESERGLLLSGEFPTFEVDTSRVDPRWLRYWLLSPVGLQEVGARSAGSTPGSRNRLREDRFLEIPLPIPPLPDQQRGADRMDETRDGSDRLEASSSRAIRVLTGLQASVCGRPDLDASAKRQAGWRRATLSEVMQPASDWVDVRPDASYPNVGIYSYGRGLFRKPEIEGGRTTAKRLNRIHAGQFIYSRLFAFEGAYTYVPPEFDGCFVSSEFPTFGPVHGSLEARWLAGYLRSPDRWAELRGASKGLGVRRQRVPVDAVLAYQIWLPPIEVQRKALEAIDVIELLRERHTLMDERIRALMPAALNETFASLS